MGIFRGLSGMIGTARAKAAPHGALLSSRKLIPLENVIWSSPDLSLAAIDPLLRHRLNGDHIGYLPDIIDLSEVVMSPSTVPSKMYLQDADRSDQAEKSAKTPTAPEQSPQPKQRGETSQSNQNQPSSQSHDDLKSSLRQRLYAKINHWLDENMANLGEDALQATLQSRTKSVDKPE
jgi:hypothetical protein